MSTGGRVFPSATGGGLTRAATAIFDAQQAKRARALQERQISISEQSLALQQFGQLQSFLDPNTTIGDLLPSQLDLFQRAHGVSTEGIENLVINRESLDDVLDRLTSDLIQGDGSDADLRLQATRVRAGLPPDPRILAAQGDLAELQSKAIATVIHQDDIVEMGRRIIGENPITLQFPGSDFTITLDSPTAANIYAADRARNSALIQEGDEDLVAFIQQAVKERGFELGPPGARTAIGIFDRMRESGDPTEFNEFLLNPNNPEALRLALGSLWGGIATGEQLIRNQLPSQLNFVNDLGEILARRMTKEQADDAISDIVNQLPQGVAGEFTPRIFGILGRPELTIDGQMFDPLAGEFTPIGGGPGGTAAGAGVQNRATQVRAAANLLETMDREELAGLAGEDIVAEAEAFKAAVEAPPTELTPEQREAAERLGLPAQREPDPVEGGRVAAPANIAEIQDRKVEEMRGNLRQANERLRTANPRTRNAIEQSIVRMEREIRIDSTALPFKGAATDGIPEGGLDAAELPGSVREAVSRYNATLRRLQLTNSVRAQNRLREQLRSLARVIRTAVAEA